MPDKLTISKNILSSPAMPFWLRAYNQLAKPWASTTVSAEHIVSRALKRNRSLGEHKPLLLSEKARERLEVMCCDMQEHANFSPFGFWVTKKAIEDCLVTRNSVEHSLQANPSAAISQIKRPIFILGLPRTGTTILFNLLAQDDAHRSPRTWEVDHPEPAPQQADYAQGKRLIKSQKSIDAFHNLAPAFNAIHPQGATLAEEDQRIMAMNMGGCGFQHFFRCPNFQALQLAENAYDSFAWHKRYLQHLQTNFSKPRWLLKSPDDTLYLNAIFETYPDALIIHTHRHPNEAIASVASLTHTVRRVFANSIDAAEVGRDQLDFWSAALQRCLVDRQALNKEERFVDVLFEDLVANPLAVVRGIYTQFDLELSANTQQKMENFLSDNTRGRYGKHKYHLEQFGLNQTDIQTKFGDYIAQHIS